MYIRQLETVSYYVCNDRKESKQPAFGIYDNGGFIMKLHYNVTGPERKSLVAAISQELNAPIHYHGTPTFAYEVGGYHIDQTGTVTGPDNLELEADLRGLHGFAAVEREYDEPDTYESGLGGMGATNFLILQTCQ